MARIDDQIAKSADSVLKFLMVKNVKTMSYRDFAITALSYNRYASDSNTKYLVDHLSDVELTNDGTYNDSLDRVLAEIRRNIYSGTYSAKEEVEMLRKIGKALEWINKFQSVNVSPEIILQSKSIVLAEDILERAQEKCPVKEMPDGSRPATLLNSGDWHLTDTGFEVGFYTPYAWFAHENIAGKSTAHHPMHHVKYFGKIWYSYNCTGDGKFLELAAQEVFPTKTIVCSNEDGAVVFRYEWDWGWI